MSERYIVVTGWDKHQHYKDQTRPAWIKLHTSLLHNDEWLNLTEGQRSALIGIWLLYASTARHVAVNTASLSRQIGQRVTRHTLDALNEAGFIEFRSRDALEQVYAREEKRRVEKNSKDVSSAREPKSGTEWAGQREKELDQEKQERGNGWVDNLNAYTGCRIIRGEVGISTIYHPLGTEPVPVGWPHKRPTKAEILRALEEIAVA